MDPITLAIYTAIIEGVVSTTTEIAIKTTKDLYIRLRDLIKKKYGKNNDLDKAIDSFERKPESEARQKLVAEEVASFSADKDQEILEIALTLLKQLGIKPGSEQNIQFAIGSNIVQADRGGKASLAINQRKKSHDRKR